MYLEQFRRMTLFAAHGILLALRGDPKHPEAARLALEIQGDLLQLEETIPTGFKHWAAALEETFVDELVRAAIAEAESWPLPEFRLATVVDEDGLAMVLCRRDAVESFKVAITLLMLRRDSAPCFIPSFGALCETLRRSTRSSKPGYRVTLREFYSACGRACARNRYVELLSEGIPARPHGKTTRSVTCRLPRKNPSLVPGSN
jgi:hypothetical protein